MKTAAQTDGEAALQWCADLLDDARSSHPHATAQRYIDTAIYVLTGDARVDTQYPTELTPAEKRALCKASETAEGGKICVVRGGRYDECDDCPYYTEGE